MYVCYRSNAFVGMCSRPGVHAPQVVKGAEVLKAGWAETLLPKGYWNMPAFTASNAELRAEAKGFPANPYEVALEDVEASAKLREAQSKK